MRNLIVWKGNTAKKCQNSEIKNRQKYWKLFTKSNMIYSEKHHQ